jgi:hypothetical protein
MTQGRSDSSPSTSIYNRELPIFLGPISDVIPSSSFENYPIGFLTLSVI